MDDTPKSYLQVMLDNLDVVPDRQGPSLLEMLDEISRRGPDEININIRTVCDKPKRQKPDFLPPYLRVIK